MTKSKGPTQVLPGVNAPRFVAIPLILAALLVLAIWPALANGQPFFFPDTTTYIRGADAAVVKALHIESSWTKGTNSPTPQENAGAAESGAGFAGEAPLPQKAALTGRSVYYGALLYIGHLIDQLWPVVVVQAAAFLAALALTLVHFRIFTWPRFAAVSALLCAFSSPAFYNSFLMPYSFTALSILGAANLLVFGRKMSGTQAAAWLVILSLAMLFHTSHLMTGAAILGAAGLLGLVRRDLISWRGFAVVLAAFVIAAAGEAAFRIGVTKLTGSAPIDPPLIMARIIGDGEGYDYLKTHCPEANFVVCKFMDRLPQPNSDMFLWDTDPAIGIFAPADLATKRALSAEQWRFARTVIISDPWGYLGKSLGNLGLQLVSFKLEDFGYPQAELDHFLDRVPEPYLSRLLRTPAAKEDFPENVFSILNDVLVIAALIIFIAALVTRRRAYVAPRMLLFAGVVFFGLLINAAICALIAMPHHRYQSRVIWLVPAMVLMIEIKSGQSTNLRWLPWNRNRLVA